tara:strand:- start:4424 stop:5026 length:603 start_codon:yes stop_codon:yes gene_type:complete
VDRLVQKNFLLTNLDPLPVLVDSNVIANNPDQAYFKGVIFAGCSIMCRVLSFHVELENGAIYERLPIDAIKWKQPEGDQLSLSQLQVYDCFSYHCTSVVYNMLFGRRCNVYVPGKGFFAGKYYCTIDWAIGSGGESPEIRKSAYLIQLDNGQIAAQPSNRIIWRDPVPDDFKAPPLKVQVELKSVEAGSAGWEFTLLKQE